MQNDVKERNRHAKRAENKAARKTRQESRKARKTGRENGMARKTERKNKTGTQNERKTRQHAKQGKKTRGHAKRCQNEGGHAEWCQNSEAKTSEKAMRIQECRKRLEKAKGELEQRVCKNRRCLGPLRVGVKTYRGESVQRRDHHLLATVSH